MIKLYIMRGIPGSGKSTFARKLMEGSPEPFARVNRDLLREMIHFGKWSPENEEVIKGAESILVRKFLHEGLTVIVDDTNLKDSDVEKWVEIAQQCHAEPILYTVQASLETCILRDKEREKSVGENVVRDMYSRMIADKAPASFEGKIKICFIDTDESVTNKENEKDTDRV